MVAFRAKADALWALVLLIGIGCTSQPDQPDLVEWQGPTMGTQWQISFGVDSLATNARSDALRQQVEDELARINALMSTWDPDSELSRFNANNTLDPIALHPDTLAVLAQAQRVAEATDGAYDVTRGTVFALWGFGADDSQIAAPSVTELQEALSSSGWKSIRIEERAVRKGFPGLTIDLSSLAKGFAVDQLGALLESNGVENYAVNIGGEIRTRGERSENMPWRIGIERPDTSVTTGLELRDANLASSGSYRNVRLIDGKRVSHLIHGGTGTPIRHNLVAVTVLHDSTLLADAWATAFMILGGADTKHYLERHDLAVQLTFLDTPDSALDAPDPAAPDSAAFSLWHSPAWTHYKTVTLD